MAVMLCYDVTGCGDDAMWRSWWAVVTIDCGGSEAAWTKVCVTRLAG